MMAEGVLGMVVTHSMVSIEVEWMERNTTVDAKTTHRIEAARRKEVLMNQRIGRVLQ